VRRDQRAEVGEFPTGGARYAARMRRILLGLLAAIVLGVGACTLFLPERYAVNAPLLGSIFGADLARSEFERRVRVPEGFEIGVFAEGIRNARFLRFTPAGDLLVSSPRTGSVLLVERDGDGDGAADGVGMLLEGLDRPHGLDLHDGWLYVAESGAIGRVRFDAAARSVAGELETVVGGLPEGGQHWTRTLRFGPDGWMYVSIGSNCNVCEEDDPRRAAIVRYRPDGSGEEIYATGLRNAVGFDWRPGAPEAMYATDNGRDLLGDDFPPCELDRVRRGGFYGWPYANGARVPDPDLGDRAPPGRIEESIPPAHAFGAHTAPLGITFYRGDVFPGAWRSAAFVALHGSWNRTRKSGYKVVALLFPADAPPREVDFVTGFEVDEDVIGRPVDVATGPDGALYVSDDYAGAIYRVAAAR
jgi:glucose/arabinose dehydrogenase